MEPEEALQSVVWRDDGKSLYEWQASGGRTGQCRYCFTTTAS